MKTRNGFVSNSSSSSFLIAYKPPKHHSDVPLNKYMKNLVMEAPETPLKNMFKSLLLSIVNAITSNAEQITADKWLQKCRDWGDDTHFFESLETAKQHEWEYVNRTAELFSKGFKVYEGQFSNCDMGAGGFLYDETLNFETPHLVMMHDGMGW